MGVGGTYIEDNNGNKLKTNNTINFNKAYSCYSGGGGGSSFISALSLSTESSRIKNSGDVDGGKIILEYLGV